MSRGRGREGAFSVGSRRVAALTRGTARFGDTEFVWGEVGFDSESVEWVAMSSPTRVR